ncbi:MAG TPA: SDR family oxidoreductase [Spirochaetia bacterium]|nr:SDR family oxidoreductase [Spirochaetia bacterium]
MDESKGYLVEQFGLHGRTVVITGGAGVLASSMAEALLSAGAHVSLWGRHEESLQESASRVGLAAKAVDRVDWVLADAQSEGSMEEATRACVQRHGRIDVLVNAVGGNRGKTAFLDTDITLFEEVLKLNLVAGFMVPTKVLCRHWIERKEHASVINMASMSSYVPLSGVWAYDAAKAAVLNLTMAAAKEFAPHGIRVNAIAPGFFLGKQNKALLVDEKTGNLTQRGRDIISRTPFARFGNPEDLAGATVFLASEKASGFVTGICIPVDGGFLVDCV